MKNLTNILSYLWLLLLMAVTACSDLEEEVGPMHVEEEVELNIQLHVPDMQASTREEMVITENISSIVAIAFDESGALIKKVDAILSDQDHENHSGTLKIKVPKRTRTIHFLGNYTKESIASITSLETLNNFTTTDDTTMPTMRYWGMTTFDDSNIINQPVTLYRNMAKLTLKTGDGFTPNSCYIAGFVNRNISGTIVPSGYAVEDTPTIPNNVGKDSYEADNRLGNVYYLFEHANVKNNSPLYVIIEVDDKYYKIAFASGDTYFPILRNRAYEITVTEPLDEMYAEANYPAAVNSQYPINDLVITSVPMTVTASPTEVQNESGQTFTVTVTIPGGITELNVPTHDAFDITPPNSLTPQNGKYTITEGNYDFTFTVKPDVEAGNKTISFSGRGKYLKATGSANIGLYDNVQLTVTADLATIYNTAGSTRNVAVSVPQGITTLTIPDATTAEFIVSSTDVTLNNNSCDVSDKQGQTVTFTLALRTDGNVGDPKTVTFNGSGQYKRATGSTTLTLEQAPAQEILSEYELWVENGAWNGSTNYNTFFTRNGNITPGNAANLESTFYDTKADKRMSQAMVMGQDNSISFTIPDTRYLTLLVASNNGNTPSIQLSNGTWATATSSKDIVPDNYNFGNGEIGTNGRLIRYELPAGTYTLQGSNTSYLLYYLRVSTERPTMTDTNAVQVEASNYVLSWSDATTMSRSLKKDNTHYFVDEEATTFTAKLNYQEWENVNLTTTELTVSTVTWTFNNENDETPGTKNLPTDLTYSGNESITDLTHNAGSYTLKGTVAVAPNASYKYGEFYDRLALKPVTFEAKNTIKVGLYDSWDGDAATVDRYNDETPLIIGFKMPQHTLPIEPGNNINFAINKEWVREASGSGIAYETNGDVTNYRIGNQDSHLHTRTEWTYKIQWRDVAAEEITVTTTDADVYFSYKGNISKTQTIDTPIDNDKLNIALDFYADVDNIDGITDAESNRSENGNVYDDLRLGTSRFFLKATISYEDAKKFASNGSVQLKGDYSTLNGCAIGGLAINWGGSKQSGEITCTTDGNGTSLNFTIQQNQTEYLIEWVFVPGQYYNNGGDIGFAYNIGNVNGQNYELSGETRADIAFTNENNYTPSTPSENGVIFNCNFNDGSIGDVYKSSSRGEVYVEDRALVLKNESALTNSWNAQARIQSNQFKNNQKYRLTFKIKFGDDALNNKLQFALTNDNNEHDNYVYLEYLNGYNGLTKEWQSCSHEFTTHIVATYFNINFGEFQGTLYIDDLKLVEVNE